MEKVINFIKENLVYIVIIILVLLIKTYIVSPIKVNGPSMEKTLYDKDIMILDEFSYRLHDIERFDIVVLKAHSEYLIKRVIGLPGEVIRYENNTLYVNGKKVAENFSHEETTDFETKVEEGCYFVLGDNRVNSTDSRILGSISKENILGKTNFIIYPFNRFGKVENN